MKRSTGLGLSRLVGIAALLSASILAEEFTGTLSFTNCIWDQLKFGLRADNVDGFDDVAIDPDWALPPPPPTGDSYAGFWISAYFGLLREDYRLDPAPDGKLWSLIVSKTEPASTISLSWTVSGLDTASTLELLSSDQQVVVPDLNVAGSLTDVPAGTYYIRYGTADIPDEGTVDVTIMKQENSLSEAYAAGCWRITKTTMTDSVYDAALSIDGADVSYSSGNPIWRNGVTEGGNGKMLMSLQTGDYLIHFMPVDASWATPTKQMITLAAGQVLLVSGVYHKIAAVLTAFPTSLTTSESGGKATITVSVGAEPTTDVSVEISASDATVVGLVDGEDVVTTKTLTFTPENWATAQTVEVKGIEDINTTNDAYTVSFVTTSTDDRYDAFALTTVNGVTVDNDIPGITVTPQVGLVTTEDQTDNGGGADADLTVKLNAQPTSDVVIDITSLDTSEGAVSPASLLFTPVDWEVPQIVELTGLDDGVLDGNIPYRVMLTVNDDVSDPTYAGRRGDLHVINIDDESGELATDVSFFPHALDFGSVTEDEKATAYLMLLNGGSTDESFDVWVTPEDSAFSLGASSVTVEGGGSTCLMVHFQPGSVADYAGSVSFSRQGSIANVMALAGSGVQVVEGAQLTIKPENLLAKPSSDIDEDGYVSCSFSVDLASDQTLAYLSFEVAMPAIADLGNMVISTNRARTAGGDFGLGISGQSLLASYMDLSGERGIASGTGKIMTIDMAVQVQAPGVYPIDIVQGVGSPEESQIITRRAFLVVGEGIPSIDVDRNGVAEITDLIFINRKLNVYDFLAQFELESIENVIKASDASALPPNVTPQQVIDNIDALGTGLDVDRDGMAELNDLIYINRKLNIYDFKVNNGLPASPGDIVRASEESNLPAGISPQDVTDNIQTIQP